MLKIMTAMAFLILFVQPLQSDQRLSSQPEKTTFSSNDPQYKRYSVKEILEYPVDHELVRLSGEIIKKLHCNIYLFKDKTGTVHIEIMNNEIPKEGLRFLSPVMIKGETLKAGKNHSKVIDASEIRYLF